MNTIKANFNLIRPNNLYVVDLNWIPFNTFCFKKNIFDPTCSISEFLLEKLKIKFDLLDLHKNNVSNAVDFVENNVSKINSIIDEYAYFSIMLNLYEGNYNDNFYINKNINEVKELIKYQKAVDVLPPILNNSQVNYISNVDSPVTIEFIKSGIYAISDYYGNLTSSIFIESERYTVNKTVLGTYQITFAVIDPSNNKSTLTINV